MTEEILKIKAQELATIRLIFTGLDAQTVELDLAQAYVYLQRCSDRALHTALSGLLSGLSYFSKKDVEPSLEFVIPVKR
jgi:hypothetical protein